MRISKRLLGAAAVAVMAVVGTASVAGATPSVKYQLTVSDDFSSGSINFVVATVPPEVEPAVVKVGFANNSVAPHVLIAAGGLPEGITLEEFADLIEANPNGPPEGVFDAGAVFAKPGQDKQSKFDLTTPGQYGFFCPIQSPDGTPHYREGFIGLFEVEGP